MALEKEISTYYRELDNLLLNEGKFVLIQDDKVEGIFDTYEDALKVGYERFKLTPFLVKKVQATEQIQFFTRDIFFICPT